MISRMDMAYLVSAGGTPPEIFSTWDGTLRTLVGVVVGLAVGMLLGGIHRHRHMRRPPR